MFRNEKCLGFIHRYNLLKDFQNKEIDSKKTLLKHLYTNGSVKEYQFLNRGSNKFYCSDREKKVPVCEMLETSAFFSSFVMETEERQVYKSCII